MKNRIIIFIIILTIIISIFVIKILNKGNNIYKSADKIVEYILNIKSYKANAKIMITSNKTQNVYVVNQIYFKDKNVYKQEIIEPASIAGVTTYYNGNTMKITGANNEVKEILFAYPYIAENALDLNSFISQYNDSSNRQIIEEDNQIVVEIKLAEENKYAKVKKLYIDKKTYKPIKLEVMDDALNVKIYILYNEIEINNLQNTEKI